MSSRSILYMMQSPKLQKMTLHLTNSQKYCPDQLDRLTLPLERLYKFIKTKLLTKNSVISISQTGHKLQVWIHENRPKPQKSKKCSFRALLASEWVIWGHFWPLIPIPKPQISVRLTLFSHLLILLVLLMVVMMIKIMMMMVMMIVILMIVVRAMMMIKEAMIFRMIIMMIMPQKREKRQKSWLNLPKSINYARYRAQNMCRSNNFDFSRYFSTVGRVTQII